MTYGAEIPYRCYWSTPFVRWQGALRDLHSIKLAAHVSRRQLRKLDIEPDVFDLAVLGCTVPQQGSFFGAPWYAGLVGATQAGGPTVSQACATGVRSLLTAAQEIESGMSRVALVTACDRTSNGPHIVYPSPAGAGGTVGHENPIWDNMQRDPFGGHSMLATAENVARKHGVGTSEQHDVVLRRTEQYAAALAGDRAFQKGYLTLGLEIPGADFRKTVGVLDGDEGVTTSTAEGLARLKPVMDGGTVTYGGQTHPADGNASIILADADQARALSRDPKICITLEGFGLARAPLAHMPEAPVPAARRALENAGLDIGRIDVVNSHNPFAINDIVFSRETGFDLMAMNNFGCSLIWGHPQGPTGIRGVIEMIEELVMRGGGTGLFQGCAAGDTAMAVVIKVNDRREH